MLLIHTLLMNLVVDKQHSLASTGMGTSKKRVSTCDKAAPQTKRRATPAPTNETCSAATNETNRTSGTEPTEELEQSTPHG